MGKDEPFDLNGTYQIVRDLLQDEDLPEEDLRVFMRSQMFLELCPELHRSFVISEQLETPEKKVEKAGSSKNHQLINKGKSEEVSKTKEDKSEKSKVGHNNVKQEKQSSSIKKETGDGSYPKKSKPRFLSSSESSYSKPAKNIKKEDDLKKKKKLNKIVKVDYTSDSSASSSADRKPVVQKKSEKQKDVVKKETEKEDVPKVHPFWLGKMGPTLQPKGKLFESEEEEDRDERIREKRKKKKRRDETIRKKPVVREPKPWTFYNSALSKIGRNNKNWKPYTDLEFNRKQKRYKLKPLSVLCVDLLNLDTFFHSPNLKGPPACSTAVPLKRHMSISTAKGEMIERLEKLKRESFKPVLNKLYAKSLKDRRASRDFASSTDGERGRKEKKAHRRVVDSSSDSSSDPIVPKKGMQQSSRGQKGKDKINARKGTAEYKAEERKRKLDTIKATAEQRFNNKGSRKLPWENPQYFGGQKKDQKSGKKDDKLTPREREKKRLEDKLKLSKPHAPAMSFQKILAQIESANKEAAKKPPVALRIPKLSDRRSEYVKPTRPIQVGDVATEVTKLLASETKIEIPVMPSETVDLADYTIRKIAWWFLKSEKDPTDDVLVHPEMHDEEIMEPWFVPKNKDTDWDSDTSSIGCVSDPEGVNKLQVNEITSSVVMDIDGDKADEFCGLTSLQSAIRRPVPGSNGVGDLFKPFFKVRPGSNYEKPNFEAKCFLCEEKVVGQRQLGAHIRSKSHKNHFRNYSLTLANYDESCIPAVYKKWFVAKLVTYAGENPVVTDSSEPKCNKIEIDMHITDSPRAMIDGEANSPEMMRINDIPVDELSLPSITMFDLRPDDEQLQAKIALKTGGRWTDEMEIRWRKMQEAEKIIIERYNEFRDASINAPETHPRHSREWSKFWDRRSAELEAEGKNPDDHNFGAEWLVFWLKRMQEIMKEEVEKEILTMKQNLRIDFESLCTLLERAGLKLDIDETAIAKKSDPSPSTSANKNNEYVPPKKMLPDVIPSKQRIPEKIEPSKARVTISQDHQYKNLENKFEPPTIKDELFDKPFPKAKEFVEMNKDQDEGVKSKVEAVKVEEKYEPSSSNIKKPPVAPPPPRISLELNDYKQNKVKQDSNLRNRRDSQDEKKYQSHKYKRDRQDSRDERRRMSPDDGKSRRNYGDKNINNRRSTSKEKRDRRHPPPRETSSGSDWGRPKSKKHKKSSSESDWEQPSSRKHKKSRSKKESSSESDWETKSNKDVLTTDNKPKDLATALEKLREAMESVEPIMQDNNANLANNEAEPWELENVSEPGEVFAGSVDVSVEMELEDATTGNDHMTDVACEEPSNAETPKVNWAVETVPEAAGRSSPEEGEIDSCVSSVSSISLGVNLNMNKVSSFIKKKSPHKKKKKKKKPSRPSYNEYPYHHW